MNVSVQVPNNGKRLTIETMLPGYRSTNSLTDRHAICPNWSRAGRIDIGKCPRRDSNPEPTDYESAALTVELQGHNNLRVVDFGL